MEREKKGNRRVRKRAKKSQQHTPFKYSSQCKQSSWSTFYVHSNARCAHKHQTCQITTTKTTQTYSCVEVVTSTILIQHTAYNRSYIPQNAYRPTTQKIPLYSMLCTNDNNSNGTQCLKLPQALLPNLYYKAHRIMKCTRTHTHSHNAE